MVHSDTNLGIKEGGSQGLRGTEALKQRNEGLLWIPVALNPKP